MNIGHIFQADDRKRSPGKGIEVGNERGAPEAGGALSWIESKWAISQGFVPWEAVGKQDYWPCFSRLGEQGKANG